MLDKLVASVIEVAETDDVDALDVACVALVERLPLEPDSIESETAKKTLKALRSHRRFDQLRRVANAFLIDGCLDPQITRFMAQGMIEAGEVFPAIGALEHALQDADISLADWAELKAALGRAWKDLAIQLRDVRPEQAKNASRQSFESYRDVWLRTKCKVQPHAMKDFTYQGVNMVAVSHWDGGFALTLEERDEANLTATEIVETISKLPEEKRANWDYATAGEACIGLGDYEAATRWYDSYILREDSAFALAGSARQLQQLWDADNQNWGQKILAVLIGKLGVEPGATFAVSPSALQRLASVPKTRHEAVLGQTGSKTYDWLQEGLAAARSVAAIFRNASPHGTGFVVRGRDLDSSLGDELLILTNAHVVSDPPEPKAASLQQATVQFVLLNRGGVRTSHSVQEVVWQSPSDEHDVAVLRVLPTIPEESGTMSLYDKLPTLSEGFADHLYIIGHPSGRDISFSFEDNELLDYELEVYDAPNSIEPCRIHYRTPTEPGSSGSPIFDVNWRIIGIHHAGGRYVTKLNKRTGVYAANEGLWIETIRRAMQKEGPFKPRSS